MERGCGSAGPGILTLVQPGLDDPIFALATPLAPSALAVIRTSGRGSLGLLAAVLRGGRTWSGPTATPCAGR